MNVILLLLAVALTVLLFISLRTMQQDHLFSISHRAETGIWFMMTIYMFSIVFCDGQSDLMRSAETNIEAAAMFKMIVMGLMLCRLLAVAAFTLGNPPKVRIEMNPEGHRLQAVAVTDSPGTERDRQGEGHVVL
jgi:hypothetical protein